jgi:hypothetical protein
VNVAHLQQHLAGLAKLLEASGAGKTVVADLKALGDRLSAFREMPLRAFADFLVAAQEAVRKGEALQPPGRKPATRAPAAKKPTKADAGVVAAEVKSLYERAASSEVTEERINEVLGKLDGLRKKELEIVAQGMQIPLKKSETIASLVKEIRFWITDRRGKALRAVL